MIFRVLACCVHVSLTSWSLGQGALTDDVQRAISARKFGSARVGVSIRDVETGTVLAAVRADEPFIPASNMKVLTSGAALLVLGPDFVFRTEFAVDGDRLIVRGSGDPALADPEVLAEMTPRLTVSDVLGAVAEGAARAGVKSLREVVVDDRVFDREFVHPTWPSEKLDRGYSAQVAGLNFHANVLSFFPRPGPQGVGTPPSFSMEPAADWLGVENRARTVREGKNAVWLSREAGTNRFVLRGEVRSAVQAGVEVTLHNPPDFFADLLAAELSEEGVAFPVSFTQAGRVAEMGEVLDGGAAIAGISTPINEALRRCNTDSANLYAECLMKRVGHAVTKEPGSWSNGAAVLRMVLAQKLGASAAAGITISDGSGLSRDNAVSPGTLSRWLGVMASEAATRDVFIDSLATPGNGTLRRRFQGVKLRNELHAKSGFINGVRTLSGYVIDPNTGRRVAFSVMINDIQSDVQTVASLELHEEVVKIADAWLDRQSGSVNKDLGG